MGRLGIYSWFGFILPMEERFRLMKQAGFDCALLWWGDEFEEIDGPKAEHPEMARKHGITLENVHLPYSEANELWTDGLKTEELIKTYARGINDCSLYNIPTIVMHVTEGCNPPPVTSKGLGRLKELVELAEKKNVNIALENLRSPAHLKYLLSGVDSDRLGFCYDSGHENCFRKDGDYLPQYGSRLMAMHLHDNDGSDDQHLVPGEGRIDWQRVAGNLHAAGYTGALTLEVTNEFSSLRDKETAEEFLRRAFTAASRVGDLVS